MFRRPSVRYGRTPEPETPYQKAAQVWDERIGSARVQAKNWRLMAFGSLVLSGCLARRTGLAISARHRSRPGWCEIDKLGQAQAIAPASADYQPTDPQIAYHLARFIEDVRGLPADPIILRQQWLRAYDFTTDRGAIALNEYRAHQRSLRQSRKDADLRRSLQRHPRFAGYLPRRLDPAPLRERLARSTERWTAILSIVASDPARRRPSAEEPARGLRQFHQLVEGAGVNEAADFP